MPSTHRVDAGPLTLVAYDWGGDGDPVLLAHATGFHGRVWEPVANRLVAAGRRVWSFDFRGHGDSDRPPDLDFRWEGFADDVLAVVDAFGLAGDPRLLAAGHSKGAAALLLAEQARTGALARIWAYEPIVIPTEEPGDPQPDFPLAVSARRRRAEWASPEEALASYGSRPPFDVLHADALRAYVDHGLRRRDDGSFELTCLPNDEASTYAMQFAHSAYRHLEDVRCPTVVACGEDTDAIPPKLAAMIAERLPDARLEVMPGLGHFGPIQDPDAAVASMRAFADVRG
ncbi:MAG: alpha/beta fold hydrolase [Acidimicrobiia bacterium]